MFLKGAAEPQPPVTTPHPRWVALWKSFLPCETSAKCGKQKRRWLRQLRLPGFFNSHRRKSSTSASKFRSFEKDKLRKPGFVLSPHLSQWFRKEQPVWHWLKRRRAQRKQGWRTQETTRYFLTCFNRCHTWICLWCLAQSPHGWRPLKRRTPQCLWWTRCWAQSPSSQRLQTPTLINKTNYFLG